MSDVPLRRNMVELSRNGIVLCFAEVARTHRQKLIGLMGRGRIEGAMVFPQVTRVHTFGMRRPIDVAYCAADGTVIEVETLSPFRIGKRVRAEEHGAKVSFVVEAAAGRMLAWGIQPGNILHVGSR